MKRGLIAWMAVLMTAVSVPAWGQKDKSVYNQWASMEYKQWNFESDSYYYSRVWRRIINMPWPIPDIYGWKPGEGFHDRGIWIPATDIYIPYLLNPYAIAAAHWDAAYQPDNYVNEEWRQYIGLRTPASASSVLYKNESNRELDYWQNIQKIDIATLGDRTGVLSGLTSAASVTESERQDAIDDILKSLEKIENQKIRQYIVDEYYALEEKVITIETAHMDNAKKLISLTEINSEYIALARKAKSYANLERIQKINALGDNEKRQQISWLDKIANTPTVKEKVNKVLKLVNVNKL